MSGSVLYALPSRLAKLQVQIFNTAQKKLVILTICSRGSHGELYVSKVKFLVSTTIEVVELSQNFSTVHSVQLRHLSKSRFDRLFRIFDKHNRI